MYKEITLLQISYIFVVSSIDTHGGNASYKQILQES